MTPHPGPMGELPPMELIPKADAALHLAVLLDGKSRTDVVNRALQVYAWIREQQHAGHHIALVTDGVPVVVDFVEDTPL